MKIRKYILDAIVALASLQYAVRAYDNQHGAESYLLYTIVIMLYYFIREWEVQNEQDEDE